MKFLLTITLLVATTLLCSAQDSIVVQVHASYAKVGRLHKLFFGENYRKEWAAPTKLPLIRLSEINGGLKPTQLGGGMQSISLRLSDKNDKEWVIRSVEKNPDALLPEALRKTFARDWLDDATSAQHPFSALIVPPLANAANIPHANPIIGVIAPDKNLGTFSPKFENLVMLLEEREPLGKSDNSGEMKENLQKDNDNKLEAREFLRARMLDMLLGDWDRHADQWRWYDIQKGKNKTYLGVPRDRDQVFRVTQGLFAKIASREYVLPTLRNFDAGLTHVKWLMFKTNFVNAYPESQFNHEEWAAIANDFKNAITDSVLEAGLLRLPQSSYELRHDELLRKLKSRRNRLSEAMEEFYRFNEKIVDIRTSDKNEKVQVTDAPNGGLNVIISKLNKKDEVSDVLMNKNFDPALTKEIRIFTGNGNDSVIVNNTASKINLRLIGGDDAKAYHIVSSVKKIPVYNKQNSSSYTGDAYLKKHISDDSLNTAFTPVNLNNVLMPLALVGLNLDDGFIIGLGFKYTKQEGFRKFPYASRQQLLAGYSFATQAYRIKYNGEWIDAIGNADFTLQAFARAPNNTTNFFGRGNETPFNKAGDYKKYYRARFSTYQLDPSVRWRFGKGSSISAGPSLYYYSFDADENDGRFITNPSLIGSYDSNAIDKNKLHLGAAVHYVNDGRDNKILPQKGHYIDIRLQAYEGVGSYSKSFAQLIPEFSFYKNLNRSASIVLAERIGGTVSIGKTAFYQSAFIGGQENLLGYRQYRFAGQHSIYNNLELRIKLADVANYIVAGQFGIVGFWDAGRVWETHDNSSQWHSGAGGGIYFAPASAVVFSLVAGGSKEGWYPYFTMGMRF